jgi:hypothetical protein
MSANLFPAFKEYDLPLLFLFPLLYESLSVSGIAISEVLFSLGYPISG